MLLPAAGQWGAGAHDAGVQFINDAWGGTSTTDRNPYVSAVDVNGAAVPSTAAAPWTTSTQHFSVVVAANAQCLSGNTLSV